MHSGVFGTIRWFFCTTRLNNTGKRHFHGNTGKYRTTKKIQEIQDTLWSLLSITETTAHTPHSHKHFVDSYIPRPVRQHQHTSSAIRELLPGDCLSLRVSRYCLHTVHNNNGHI